MSDGLGHAGYQKPRGQPISNTAAAGRDGHEKKTANHRETLDAVGMRSRQPLQKWREVRVIRLELVGSGAPGDNQIRANALHEHEQEECPCDEERQYQA